MTAQGSDFVFERVGSGRGFDRIVSSLRGAIVRGELAAGFRLPSEPDLAAQMGVSRPLLREALKVLEVSGYLEVRRGYGGGRFVVEAEPEEFHAITAAPLSTMDVEPRHVMDVRLAIEPMAARLAARAYDAGDLGRALRKLGVAGSKPGRVVDALVHFHMSLVEASANPVFVAVFDSLRAPITLTLGQRVRDPAWCAAVRDPLTHIMRLLDDGEPGAAERAVRRYLLDFEHDRKQAEEE